jgi:predicted DNA-binding transcriptional regulator YafY
MTETDSGFAKRDRAARLTRVATLLYQHRPYGLSAREIARRIDVNVRTAYRDLHAIETELGVPVWEEHGRWCTEQSAFLPPLKLSLLEAVTLFLSARLMARHTDKKDPHVLSAFGKLASVLPAPVAAHVHAIVASMADNPLDRHYARVFDAVATAWASSQKVRISYPRKDCEGRTVMTRRLVSPAYLEPNAWGPGCYLIGDDELTHDRRTFKLERIKDVELTVERFEPSSRPEAPAHLARAWIVSDGEPATVRVRFHDADAARRALETRWHPSQQVEVMPDGKVDMSFEVAGLLEITPWILTWGDTIEVVEPLELRRRVSDIARAMTQRYAVQAHEVPGTTAKNSVADVTR